jgi:Tol biopolymer transport system component
MPADGGAAPDLVRDSAGRNETAHSWSTTDVLAFVRNEPTGPDIWVVNVDGERTARPFLVTRFDEVHPRFSPDARWMAYASNESGRFEVYVRPFPGPGQKRLVSSDGGSEPRWRSDGRELFYKNGDEIVAVDVTPGPALTVSLPRVLFKAPSQALTLGWGTWDVTPDGKGFLLIESFAKPRTTMSLVQNWFEELKRR